MLSQAGFYSPQVNAGLAISVIGTIIFAIYFVGSVLLCVGASKGRFMLFDTKHDDKFLIILLFSAIILKISSKPIK